MLGVSIENNFSIAQHVQRLVTASAQTVYALRVLRTRGLDDDAPQHIYCATVVARLCVARSHQSTRPQAHRLCAGSRAPPRVLPGSLNLPPFDELCNIADDELFGRFAGQYPWRRARSSTESMRLRSGGVRQSSDDGGAVNVLQSVVVQSADP